MNAKAYATGSHVVSDGPMDKHTAAHEATHIVQQQAGVQLKDNIGTVGDPYERQADAVADAVVAGRSAEGILGSKEMAGGSNDQEPKQMKAGTKQIAPVQRILDARYGNDALKVDLEDILGKERQVEVAMAGRLVKESTTLITNKKELSGFLFRESLDINWLYKRLFEEEKK